jgi:citrate lyase subunit beta/citryl-CoA lyase
MRSLLFVPGDSQKKLDKSITSGADALIVDLEDSVGPTRKAEARVSALAFLHHIRTVNDGCTVYVRVNAFDTGLTDDDLQAVVPGRPDGILLPKAEGGPSVTHLDAKLTALEAIHGLQDGAIGIIALTTETPAALFTNGSYRSASPRLQALTWGAEDLSAGLGAETNRDEKGRFTDPYRLARTLCLAGAAAAGLSALDTVFVDYRDEAGLRREAEEARRDGFTGKLAIHPAQAPIINAVFTPTPEAVAHAQELADAFEAEPDAGVIGIGGKMYDRPHLMRAQRLLARAKWVAGKRP